MYVLMYIQMCINLQHLFVVAFARTPTDDDRASNSNPEAAKRPTVGPLAHGPWGMGTQCTQFMAIKMQCKANVQLIKGPLSHLQMALLLSSIVLVVVVFFVVAVCASIVAASHKRVGRFIE